MPSPPGCEADPFFDWEFLAPEGVRPEPNLLAQLEVPGLELRRFISAHLRALAAQMAEPQPQRPPKPRVRTRGQIMRGE